MAQQQREILALRQRVAGEGSAEDGALSEAAALREENMALEQKLSQALEDKALVGGQIRQLEAQLRAQERAGGGGGGGEAGAAEPEDTPTAEHTLRKRVRSEQAEGHDCLAGLRVTQADVAELAFVWGMDVTRHGHLLWIPQRLENCYYICRIH